MARRNHLALVALLRDAESSGEVLPGDHVATARLLSAVTVGSLLQWAIMREGSARDWLSRDLDRVLAPSLRRPAGARSRR